MSDLSPEGFATGEGMSGSGAAEDRVVGLDPIDGLVFESDGTPIAELDLEQLDAMASRLDTVAEQAVGRRSWRFGHVIVDEAQDLTPMQWRMVARRAQRGSMTIVGDLAQRSRGDATTWSELLPPTLAGFDYRELTINYRSPEEVNAVASAVLAELAPGLTPSQPIRAVGHLPTAELVHDLDRRLTERITEYRRRHASGRMAVIGVDLPPVASVPGTQWLTPWQAKGLEFDHVVLVEPARFLDERRGLSLLYVAITRTTDRLFVLHERALPRLLRPHLTAIDGPEQE
jgi:DNA helicase IV